MDRALVVLQIEDSTSDQYLTAETLNASGLTLQLMQVKSGEQGLAVLRNEGQYLDAPRPDLVLLDLGLPGMSGREVLAEIRADDELRSIPVVVQTADDDDRTVVETLGLGAHEFVTKPIAVEQFLAVVEYVTEFA